MTLIIERGDVVWLLQRLKMANVSIRVEDGMLRLSPRERLTDELRAELRSLKPELLCTLAARADRRGRMVGLDRCAAGTRAQTARAAHAGATKL
ncbi:MAG: hypothetical protein ACRD52_00660 [Candidatus Acidiferrales bacterium]